jgi:coatomer subunit alpha
LAYLTAQTNGLTELAEEILANAGMTETDIDDVPKLGLSNLKPAPVVTATHEFNWPIMSTGESFFERALAGGQLTADGEAVPFGNGDTNDASVLDEWARDDPAEEEEAEATGEAAWDLDEAVYTADEEVVTQEDADAAAGATPGINESELWTRNSPFAADHAAAGSFETAMQVINSVARLQSTDSHGCFVQLLNRQVGAVNFAPLKPQFMAIYRSSHAYLSINPSLPPLHLHIRRNPDESSPGRVLPIISQSLQTAKTSLAEAYRAVALNKLDDAAALFRSILLTLLLVVVTTDDEATQVQSYLLFYTELYD